MNNQFDWYELSKLSEDKPNPQKFNEIIRNSKLNIKNIPLYHRKKLLIMFQNVSYHLKDLYIKEKEKNQELNYEKRAVRQQLDFMQTNMESSLQNIQSLKVEIKEKKQQIQKIKEKISKKKNSRPKELFYCPFCQRQDFESKDTFSFHMFKEHKQAYENKQVVNNSSEFDNLKQIIMSLKDKEIELMSMMLKQKKEMDTQQLQKEYKIELMKMNTSKPNIISEGVNANSNYEESFDDQLKGESHHLFYKEKDEDEEKKYYERLAKKRQDQASTFKKAYELEKQRYEKQVYYDIFPGISEFKKQQNKFQSRYHPEYQTRHENPKKVLENRSYPAKTLQWDESVRKPVEYYKSQVQIKTYETKKKSLQKIPSPRRTLNTVYQNKSQLDNGYIFNSGPLMDDQGNGSDIQDYFEDKNQSSGSQQIEDEEIKIDNHQVLPDKNSISAYDSIKMMSSGTKSNHMNILDYSKQKSSLDYSKQRSMFGSNAQSSFSKRDFQLSKDDDTINLSDLKLSKLEKQEKKKEKEKVPQKEIGFKKNKNAGESVLNQFILQEEKVQFSQKKVQNYEPQYKISKPEYSRENTQKSNVLEEFIRQDRSEFLSQFSK